VVDYVVKNCQGFATGTMLEILKKDNKGCSLLIKFYLFHVNLWPHTAILTPVNISGSGCNYCSQAFQDTIRPGIASTALSLTTS
jgi:hypothetical protein